MKTPFVLGLIRPKIYLPGGLNGTEIGTFATYIWGKIWFCISFVIWIIYFLKNLHIDVEKAFGRYRKEN